MLNALMQELTNEWELEGPLPQEIPGVYRVPLDEGVSFTISQQSGDARHEGIALISSIAAIPKGREEELYTHALLGNLFGQGTKQAVLGLNDNGSILTLSRFIDYDVNFQAFREIVEDFINTIDFWREEALKYQ
jgi:hypothetical protein